MRVFARASGNQATEEKYAPQRRQFHGSAPRLLFNQICASKVKLLIKYRCHSIVLFLTGVEHATIGLCWLCAAIPQAKSTQNTIGESAFRWRRIGNYVDRHANQDTLQRIAGV